MLISNYSNNPVPQAIESEETTVDSKTCLNEKASIDGEPELKQFPFQKNVDEIEYITKQIFIDFHVLIDGHQRSTIKATDFQDDLEETSDDDFLLQDDPYFKKKFHAYRNRTYRNESNFDYQVGLDKPARSLDAIKHLGILVFKILFRYTSHDPDQDMRTPEKMIKDLEKNLTVWKKMLCQHYTKHYQALMDKTFKSATLLIKQRKDYERYLTFQRTIFYASGILAIVGVFFGKKILAALSTASSLLTVIFMFAHYGATSLKHAQLTSDLRFSTESLEKLANKNRLVAVPYTTT